jgi:predicted DNA-binding protein
MIEKRVKKEATISSKITEEQDKKLVKLAKEFNKTKSAIIAELLEIGYKKATKKIF